MMQQSVLFSGIQPSGKLTLGNYLGAIKNWINLQNEYFCLFSIVDLHALTVHQDPKFFKEQCYDTLAIYLASGIDFKNNIIFLQSHVPGHSQLSWILSCYTHIGELNRMIQFKNKMKNYAKDCTNVGIFIYPILMAADILLYKSLVIPVGIDQKQHLEISRDIAARFNKVYGKIFVIPEIYYSSIGTKIMSLQKINKKMSKSDNDIDGTIYLLDTKDQIVNKCRKAVTDSGKEIYFDYKSKPGISNLLTILAAISNRTINDWCIDLRQVDYKEFKDIVAEYIIKYLNPIQDKYHNIRHDKGYLDNLLKIGAERASKIANKNLLQIHKVLGLITLNNT